MNQPICVHCGSARVHRSRRHGWLDRVLLLVGGRACRCHECNARFARFGASLVRMADVNRAARRLMFALAMMTAAGIILAGVVWISHNSSMNPSDTGDSSVGREVRVG